MQDMGLTGTEVRRKNLDNQRKYNMLGINSRLLISNETNGFSGSIQKLGLPTKITHCTDQLSVRFEDSYLQEKSIHSKKSEPKNQKQELRRRLLQMKDQQKKLETQMASIIGKMENELNKQIKVNEDLRNEIQEATNEVK